MYDKITPRVPTLDNPLQFTVLGSGLRLEDELIDSPNEIYKTELELVTGNSSIHSLGNSADSPLWTVSLVTGSEIPNNLGKEYLGRSSYSIDIRTWNNARPHITLSNYLTLQSIKIINGEKPIDLHYRTWIFNNLNRYPHIEARWESFGFVSIDKVIDKSRFDMGNRLTVWG